MTGDGLGTLMFPASSLAFLTGDQEVIIECPYLKGHYSIRYYLHLWGDVPSAVSLGNHPVFFELLFKLVQMSL